MFSSAIAVALLFSQAAADAATDSKKADPQDRVVCRSVTHIGSMIPKRKCRTMREWNASSKATSDATRNEMQNGSMSGGANTGG